jgi:hypothetical protein
MCPVDLECEVGVWLEFRKGLKVRSTSTFGIPVCAPSKPYGVSKFLSRSKSNTGAILNCPRLCLTAALKIA